MTKCVERKYIAQGRFGQWYPCDSEARYDVVAASPGGSGERRFTPGDTIHVCGTHKRMHEQRAKKEAMHADRELAQASAETEAGRRAKALGAGEPYYRPYRNAKSPGGYTGGLILTAEEVDALLKELGR